MNIYVHIPFCRSKCAYCAFLSFADKNYGQYLTRIFQEIEIRSKESKNKKAETIYFGGGTPSLLDEGQLSLVFAKLRTHYKFAKNIEITIEANPEDIDENKLKMWKNLGINRVSIGVQTLNDKVRKKIGRRLTAQEVLGRIIQTKSIFQNVSVDFIAGLPGDDIEVFMENIKLVNKIGVTHISVYDLEIEANSAFGRNRENYDFLEETKREEFLLKSWDLLEKLGFEQYEISNFAKKKRYCGHNLSFWEGNDYIGFGLGAASRLNGRIINNNFEMKEYFKKYVFSEEKLTKNQNAEFDLMIGLRLNKNILSAIKKYESDTGKNLKKTINELERKGLISKNKITTKGRLFYNFMVTALLV